MKLQVPQGYGCVESGLYRASSLERQNLPFIEGLNLKTLVSVDAYAPRGSVKVFADHHKVTLLHFSTQPWRAATDWKLVGQSIIQDVLMAILDYQNYPLMLVDSANLFIGVLRKVQHWTYSSILAEYTAFAGSRSFYKSEVFLEMVEVQCLRQGASPRMTPQEPVSKSTSDRFMTLTLPHDIELPPWFETHRQMWIEECKHNPAL